MTTTPSYTDEQVRELAQETDTGPSQAAVKYKTVSLMLRSLLADRQRLQAEVEALRARSAPDVSSEVEYAWQRIAKVSGSALLAGERKAQTPEQRALVYGEACQALITIGNVFFDLTGKHPTHDEAEDDADAARAKQNETKEPKS
jgi:hypothetical protein